LPTFFIPHQTGVLTRDAGFLFLKIKKATEYHTVHFVFGAATEAKVNAEFFEIYEESTDASTFPDNISSRIQDDPPRFAEVGLPSMRTPEDVGEAGSSRHTARNHDRHADCFRRRRNFISRTGIRSDGYLLKRTKSTDLRTALLDVMNGDAPMTSEIAWHVVGSFRYKANALDPSVVLTSREEETLFYSSRQKPWLTI
jgi:hypothetical protein